jgi:outer membrane protein OmpA-like peptidoglycan-associated protein
MNKILTIILLFSTSLLSFSQVDIADDLFDNHEFRRAAAQYAIVDSLSDLQVRKFAFSLLQLRDYEGAERLYEEVVKQADSNAVNFYYHGICLKNNEKFEEAKKQFQTSQKLDSTHFFGTLMLENLGDIESVYSSIKTQSAEATVKINSPLAEYNPIWYKEGVMYCQEIKHDDLENRTQLHFETDHGHVDELEYGTSERPLNVLMYVPCINGRFGEPQIVAKSDKYHIGSFDIDESTGSFYFTKTTMKNWSEKKSEHPVLYMGKIDTVNHALIDVEEVKIKKLPSESGSGHPAITKDGRTLFFASDMQGGFGGSDIYFVEKDEKSNWSEPVNLGAKINTKGDELFPVLESDSLLYYSSNGKVGYGGLDIFSVTFNKTIFSDAELLSAPVNSSADDFGILVNPFNKEEGFLVSNRFGGTGDDDIYKFQQLVKQDYITGVVFDAEEKAVLGCFADSSQVALVLEEIETTEEVDTLVAVEPVVMEEQTEPVAETIIEEPVKEEPVAETIKEEPVKEEPVAETIIEEPVAIAEQKEEPKAISTKEGIYFNFDQSSITDRSKSVLDKWVLEMKEDPRAEIMIKSYTDCLGSNGYNLSLSWRRSKAVKDYLISQGIRDTRIATKSMGAVNFVNDCNQPDDCSEEEHGENRRSEIKYLVRK